MTISHITQSQLRFNDSIGALFSDTPSDDGEGEFIFLKSSSDVGVERNGGRNGARFGPRSFLASFKRLSRNAAASQWRFREVEIASISEEVADFPLSQRLQSERIQAVLEASPRARICHIGGGHDHIFPLLLAVEKQYAKIVVINVDAHADTRTDDDPHSGTPFRQGAQLIPGLHLFQVGLHPYANSSATLSPLPSGTMEILWRRELENADAVEKFFEKIEAVIGPHDLLVFSLDADALRASEISAVSAVNHDGLSLRELRMLWQRTARLEAKKILGIYELNPVYDSLSAGSMRILAGFIFETL